MTYSARAGLSGTSHVNFPLLMSMAHSPAVHKAERHTRQCIGRMKHECTYIRTHICTNSSTVLIHATNNAEDYYIVMYSLSLYSIPHHLWVGWDCSRHWPGQAQGS